MYGILRRNVNAVGRGVGYHRTVYKLVECSILYALPADMHQTVGS